MYYNTYLQWSGTIYLVACICAVIIVLKLLGQCNALLCSYSSNCLKRGKLKEGDLHKKMMEKYFQPRMEAISSDSYYHQIAIVCVKYRFA